VWGPGVVVKALRYYSDGLGIDSWWCHCIFQWHISFRQYHGPGVDSAPSENKYQEHSWGQRRPVREAENLTTLTSQMSWNLGAYTSWNSVSHTGAVTGLLYLYRLCDLLNVGMLIWPSCRPDTGCELQVFRGFRLQWLLSGCSRSSHGKQWRSGIVHTCYQWTKWDVS
jgi:hypothetical protein